MQNAFAQVQADTQLKAWSFCGGAFAAHAEVLS